MTTVFDAKQCRKEENQHSLVVLEFFLLSFPSCDFPSFCSPSLFFRFWRLLHTNWIMMAHRRKLHVVYSSDESDIDQSSILNESTENDGEISNFSNKDNSSDCISIASPPISNNSDISSSLNETIGNLSRMILDGGSSSSSEDSLSFLNQPDEFRQKILEKDKLSSTYLPEQTSEAEIVSNKSDLKLSNTKLAKSDFIDLEDSLEFENFVQNFNSNNDKQKEEEVFVSTSNSKKCEILCLSDDDSDNKNSRLERSLSVELIGEYYSPSTSNSTHLEPFINVDQQKKNKSETQSLLLQCRQSDNMKVDIKKMKEKSEVKLRILNKKIMPWKRLEKTTRNTEKAERERRRRIETKQATFQCIFPDEDPTNTAILDFDPDNKKSLVKIDKAFFSFLKPHQIEGIKFMYDCVIESINLLKENSPGSGCVLAHSMGLGKTFQIVVFLYTILVNRHIQDHIKTVLIVVPYNVIENWAQEFELWFSKCRLYWQIHIFEMRLAKTMSKRIDMLKAWKERGGILLITSNLFTRMATDEKKDAYSLSVIEKTLLNSDLIIVDEGHLLKNDASLFNQALSLIRTNRRIVLTGTPLQNNLMEYYVMVNFIKPNLLGSKLEFKNRFQLPVEAGQLHDSTKWEVSQMKRRIHVLFQMVKGCINRCDSKILIPYLQPKFEYVLNVKLTEQQIKMYEFYLRNNVDMTQRKQKNLFRDKQLLYLIWTHPALIHDYYLESLERKENFIVSMGEWYRDYISPDTMYDATMSVKFILLFAILEYCEKIGDKLIIFSQSLFTLNLIERLLRLMMKDVRQATGGVSHRWLKDVDYFRIDGSVDSYDRTGIISHFNDTTNSRARLMLVSTRAGGIGINLVGANRAIIFDASFNPSHDLQAIFRIFRLGQTKSVYVYRFTAYGTMEDKIYKRQIVKQSLSGRVVDEQQILRHYSANDIRELYTLDADYPADQLHPLSADNLLNDLIFTHSNLILSYHEHDSLLENRPEEDLSEEERKAAWLEYEKIRQAPDEIKTLNSSNTDENNVNEKSIVSEQAGIIPEIALP